MCSKCWLRGTWWRCRALGWGRDPYGASTESHRSHRQAPVAPIATTLEGKPWLPARRPQGSITPAVRQGPAPTERSHPAHQHDHQSANARGLVGAGAAILIPERRLDKATLATQIAAVLGDPKGARLMAEAARLQGRPEAAERLADLVEDLATKGT